MATAAGSSSAPTTRTRFLFREALPWVGLAAWCAGSYAIWHFGNRAGWGVGTLVLAGTGWFAALLVAARDTVRGMFGPVFVYEVTRLGRRRLTFILRLLYVLLVLGVLGLMYLSWLERAEYFDRRGSGTVPSERLSEFATEFFAVFMVMQYCVIGFLTPAYVAGSVADEKERKTLEFLLATDLRNREIVFGKLAARVTVLLMFVLAGLPVVAFMQLFGGIDPDLLLAGTAATFVTVLGLSGVGLYFSVMRRRARDAIALTYLAAAMYLVVSGVLAGVVRGYQVAMALGGGPGVWDLGNGWVVDWSKWIDAAVDVTDLAASGNVLYAFVAGGFSSPAGFNPANIADALVRYVVFWLGVAAVCLAVGVTRLRATALAQAYGGAGGRRKKRLVRGGDRRPPVGTDPMFWKEVFVDGGVRGGCAGWVMSVIIVVMVFTVPVLIAWYQFGDLVPLIGHWLGSGVPMHSFGSRVEDFQKSMNIWARVTTGGLGSIILLAVAVRGAGAVSGERDRDTWISLISTPMSAWEMVRGKWLGCVLGVRRVYATLGLVWALALVTGSVEPVMIAATIVYLAVYVSAFAWVGVLCSITSRTTLISTVRTLMITVFIGGGFWFFLGLCCALPINLMTRGTDVELFNHLAQILLGWTPPFVLGWLPLDGFDKRDLGPFAWDHRIGIGPLAPLSGLFVWAAAAWGLGLLSWHSFRHASNRLRDNLADRLPRPRRESANRARKRSREDDDGPRGRGGKNDHPARGRGGESSDAANPST